jgi:predicted dinucleotide-binding enzyme
MSATLPVIGILGGTGALGKGLAIRWAAAGYPIDCDVLVCGDDKAAREAAIGLAKAIGLRGIDAGPLANSVAAEALTSIPIGINRRYKVDGAGIRFTGDFGASGP